jgi:hypothetical protein
MGRTVNSFIKDLTWENKWYIIYKWRDEVFVLCDDGINFIWTNIEQNNVSNLKTQFDSLRDAEEVLINLPAFDINGFDIELEIIDRNTEIYKWIM